MERSSFEKLQSPFQEGDAGGEVIKHHDSKTV